MTRAKLFLVKDDWLGEVERFQVFDETRLKLVWYGPSKTLEELIVDFDDQTFVRDLEEFARKDEDEAMIINIDENWASTVPSKDFDAILQELASRTSARDNRGQTVSTYPA
jgi:hypothetical protein